MKFSSHLRFLAISLFLVTAVAANSAQQSPWKFEVGAGMRNQTPLILLGGISYNNLNFRLQGLGFHNGPRDFWCGIRGSLSWMFFKEQPFHINLGVGGGYEYAQAPNDLHKAINTANHALYLREYNYKENLDVSAEVWTSIYGFYTQISVPFYQFMDHDVSRILWGAGYMFQF